MKQSVVNPSATHLSVSLGRGLLEVDIHLSCVAPEALFGFAERRNPKRAFLFVSRVLGKHIPVKPSVMQCTYETLAAKIPSDLPGPVLLVGMAETAVGLGAGVHRAYRKSRPDSMYIISTRHRVADLIFAGFEEEHSHATTHVIHQPADLELREMMLNARSLVLVDDEASTGQTFINLHRALVDAGLTKLARVVTCVLTDWSAGAVCTTSGSNTDQISLLSGAYKFTEDPASPPPPMPTTDDTAVGEWPIDPLNDWGRLGVRDVADTLGRHLRVSPGQKVIVLGTGEFVWKPFLLAERLEQAGANVQFGSTSRSPIALGHSIKTVLSFPDNYGLGIANYLYNVAPRQFDRVFICSETAAQALPQSLIEALGAEVIVDGV